MSLKIALTAAALTLAPGLALAEGCNWMKEQTASMSCADGTVYDADSQGCVPVAS